MFEVIQKKLKQISPKYYMHIIFEKNLRIREDTKKCVVNDQL